MLLVFVLHSIALWVLIPFGFVAWLLVHAWAQKVSPRQAVAWYDTNLMAAWAHGPFRMLADADSRPPFVGISQMGAVPGSKIPLFDVGWE
ncbi:hypothetical protein [Microbacterium sp. 179-I 3D4 NHS]|uniref:hypothetical protein n=1 Tax=Microbacterium sp. 179-I 3D4 NHS TaxID=3142381 RepID=UPI00399FEE95